MEVNCRIYCFQTPSQEVIAPWKFVEDATNFQTPAQVTALRRFVKGATSTTVLLHSLLEELAIKSRPHPLYYVTIILMIRFLAHAQTVDTRLSSPPPQTRGTRLARNIDESPH